MADAPSTIHALLGFVAFVVPGFLFRSGYVRTRARHTIDVDLYAIAEAVVGSLFILAAAWWWRGEDVLAWVQAGTLANHRQQTYWFLLALLLVPYPAGLVAGWARTAFSRVVESFRPPDGDASRRSEFFYFLDSSGILTLPTVWDQAWNQVGRLGALLVRVRTTSGKETVGTIEPGSWVGLSGEPRDVYLRRVYREDGSGDWEPIPRTEGVLFSASSVESVEFIWASADRGHSARKADRNDSRTVQGDDRPAAPDLGTVVS